MDLDRQRLEIEQRKLELEQQKLKLEQDRVKMEVMRLERTPLAGGVQQGGGGQRVLFDIRENQKLLPHFDE